jgi:hypothetical protein
MLNWIIGIPFFLFLAATKPWLLGVAVVIGILLFLHLRSKEPLPPMPVSPPPVTADGRFPLLNEDWVGEVVLSIDDAEVPEIIRRHGARFRNPARYVIDPGQGEYLLYDADGELLDLCYRE